MFNTVAHCGRDRHGCRHWTGHGMDDDESALPFRRGWMTLAALPLVVPLYARGLEPHCRHRAFGRPRRDPDAIRVRGLMAGALGVHCAAGPPHPHPGVAGHRPGHRGVGDRLGASRWRVFVTVTLPQLKPALVSSGLSWGCTPSQTSVRCRCCAMTRSPAPSTPPPRADRSEAIGDLVVDPHGPGDRDPSHRAPIPRQGRPSLTPSLQGPPSALPDWLRAASVLGLSLHPRRPRSPLAVMTITVIRRPTRSWGRSARRHFDRWGWRSSPPW